MSAVRRVNGYAAWYHTHVATLHPGLASDDVDGWAARGAGLRVAAPGQSRKVAMMGVLGAITRERIVHTASTKRSTDFISLLDTLDGRFGPRPGRKMKPVVLVVDNGRIRLPKANATAPAARA